MQEMQVQSLGQEDPLEKEMATHSSILAWEIPWAEESMGSQRVGYVSSTKGSLIAQLVKNPPAMQETLVQVLGWEDLLEKG